MDWTKGILGGGLDSLQPATANPNLWMQGILARQLPRKQLEGYEAAQMAGMVPGLGLLGMLGDAQQYIEKPETRGILNYGLTALGALPFLGAMAKMAGPMPRGIRQAEAGAIRNEPRVFFRGENPGDTRRINTGNEAWDSHLFASSDVEQAKAYGRNITQIEAKPDAKILYEGSKDFVSVAGRWRAGENLLDYASRAADAARTAGYDAVHFKMQGNVGTAIFNKDKFDFK